MTSVESFEYTDHQIIQLFTFAHLCHLQASGQEEYGEDKCW